MTAGEIARAMNAPRSTVYEIIGRLTEAQMIEPSGADGQVYFGSAMQIFGAAYLQRDARARRIRAAMDALAAQSGATVQLCAVRGDKYTVVDCRDGSGAFRITSEVGVEVPLPWTASGRLLLGPLSDEAILALVPPEDFRLPDGGMLPVQSFLDDIAVARLQGHAETTGLASSFTWCQAVPLRNALGRIDLTLCFVLPVDTDPADRARHLGWLKAQADAVSRGDEGQPDPTGF